VSQSNSTQLTVTKKSNVLDKMPPKGPKGAGGAGGGGGNNVAASLAINNTSAANNGNNNNVVVQSSGVSVSTTCFSFHGN
jgi:coronin-1B/1C/6